MSFERNRLRLMLEMMCLPLCWLNQRHKFVGRYLTAKVCRLWSAICAVQRYQFILTHVHLMSTNLWKHIGLSVFSLRERYTILRYIDEKAIRLKERLLSLAECVDGREKCIPEISHFQVINLQWTGRKRGTNPCSEGYLWSGVSPLRDHCLLLYHEQQTFGQENHSFFRNGSLARPHSNYSLMYF